MRVCTDDALEAHCHSLMSRERSQMAPRTTVSGLSCAKKPKNTLMSGNPAMDKLLKQVKRSFKPIDKAKQVVKTDKGYENWMAVLADFEDEKHYEKGCRKPAHACMRKACDELLEEWIKNVVGKRK